MTDYHNTELLAKLETMELQRNAAMNDVVNIRATAKVLEQQLIDERAKHDGSTTGTSETDNTAAATQAAPEVPVEQVS